MFPIVVYKPIISPPTLEEQFQYITSLDSLSKEELIGRVRQLYSATNSLIGMINELDKSRIELSLQLITDSWGITV